jgi:hypothetical protein
MPSGTIKLTRDQVKALRPCSDSHIPDFGRRKAMTAAQALAAGATIEDLLWVADKLGREDLCARFGLECAQRVAYLNSDPRVQAALDATQAWLDNPGPETAAARAAAWAAARAAARAAAWAAARAAARAAAGDAARAAARAAARDAAWAAAWAAEQAEQRKIFLRIFA